MRIALGVTACIAAYKSAMLLRSLQERGCEIFPVLTGSATRFVTPLTLEKLSGNRVVTDLFDDDSTDIEHIRLARSTDMLLVAPATANTLGKFAHGICDDFLSTLYISTLTPVVVAPAMNVEMWRHPATRDNLGILRDRGVVIVEPESGYLACGEYGEGRLADVEVIAEAALAAASPPRTLEGHSILVTAGPTVEDLDPVRFLSNRSSGRMGYAVAAQAARRGARVTLISGPTPLETPAGTERIDVRSAAEMAEAVNRTLDDHDIVVMAAAVADYRASRTAAQKLKKRAGNLELSLVRTPDILAQIAKQQKDRVLVGFAAESEKVVENASRKLQAKSLDLIVANDITEPGAGFGGDTNRVTLIGPEGVITRSELVSKSAIADLILDEVERRLAGSP